MIEQAARGPKNRHLLPTQQRFQLRHIAGDIFRVADDHQFGAVEQGAPHFERRRVERRAGQEQQDIFGRDRDARRGRQPAHRLLLEHHAFRHSRRPRGINDRAKPFGSGDHRQIMSFMRQTAQIAQCQHGLGCGIIAANASAAVCIEGPAITKAARVSSRICRIRA